MIEAVLFDMDGLLVDSEPFWRKAEINCFRTVNVYLDDDKCKLTMGMRIDEVVDFWFERHPWQNKSKAQLTKEIVDEMDRLLAAEAIAMPGVDSTIALCKEMGVKMALASSSNMRLIKTVVNRLKLKDHLQVVRSAEIEEYGKPHPSVFINTAKELGVSPENCLVFEDSFYGVIAALAAKMKVIAVPDSADFLSTKMDIAHFKLTSLTQFEKKHLKALSSQ